MSEQKKFSGKVVLVTGAGHGIGRAVAERFASAGARVFVNDVNADRAAEVAKAIGGEPIAADVPSKSQVDAMFDRTGAVDILVNNAGNSYADRHFLNGDE